MNPDKMIKGKVYFMYTYETPLGLIPRIDALVYLGKKIYTKKNLKTMDIISRIPKYIL